MDSGGAVEAPSTYFGRLNDKLTKSWVGRYFEIEQRNSTMFNELRAGAVCFLTVCYIIPVNSGILSDTGGTCVPANDCDPIDFAQNGPFCRFNFNDVGWQQCVYNFKLSIISSTCIAAMISTFLMSIFARMPMAVAPAMGVNAYFTYNVVGNMSTKTVTYQEALAAAFIEGWIFLFITVTGVRGRLIELIPKCIMYSTAAGIGCFLAFIGLQQSEGIGFITYDGATLVALGGCPANQRNHMYSIGASQFSYENICGGVYDYDPANLSSYWPGKQLLGAPSSNYQCTGGQMTSPTTWLGIFTGGMMVVLMMKDVRGSILIAILFCTFISWIPNHGASYLGADSQIPGGQQRLDYWRKGATLPNTSMSAGKIKFSALSKGDVWVALITFLYLDFLDATSTMFALARLVAEAVPGFVNERGQWPRQLQTMMTDGTAIIIGSLLGTSPLTVFAESAVGIREGGRTGVTSFVVAIGFGISMFLSPIFASIPPYATGPAIILVGALMMEHSRYVEWEDIRQAAPAFLTIILMPLTYSIAYGVMCGLLFLMFLWICDFGWESIKVLTGQYHGEKTMYHVWLDTMSHFYMCFNKEDVLIRDLPGWETSPHHMPEPAMPTAIHDKAQPAVRIGDNVNSMTISMTKGDVV